MSSHGVDSFNPSFPISDDLTRLHLSESPFGASTLALQAAQAVLKHVSMYPDPGRTDIVTALARLWRVSSEQLAVGNGSDELVLLTSMALGQVKEPGLVTGGTFPGYATCLTKIGRGPTVIALRDGRVDIETFVERLGDHGIGYLCNPHNPSGSILDRTELDLVVAAAMDSETPVVVDEAYMDFAPPDTPQVRDYFPDAPVDDLVSRRNVDPPLLALRTLSKAYGLAGLRLGYAIGHVSLIARLRSAQGTVPFSTNRIAQAAAVAAVEDRDFIEWVRNATAARRAWFCGELDRRGRRYLDSTTNFVTVVAANSGMLQDRLATEHGILVRDAGLFGFSGHLRISLGEVDELSRMLDAWDEMDPA